MIGQTFEIETGGKTYIFEQKDNFKALEINAVFRTVEKQADLLESEELDSSTLQRGFKGKVINEIKNVIIDCSHTPKFDEKTILELSVTSIETIFYSIFNKHFKTAEDKKKD